MDTVNWMRLEQARASASRSVVWRHTAPLALASVAGAMALMPADETSTRPAVGALVAILALAFAVLDAPSARRSFTKRHQREVLPALFKHAGVELSPAPLADPPWIVCDRTGLFPATAEKAHPTPVFHGEVDGIPLEACAFRLTRTRVKRKVRKVDVPVFDGAVFIASTAPGAPGGGLWLGRRAGWVPRKAHADLRRTGGWLPWSGRSYTCGKPAWSPEATAAVSTFLRLYPKAAVSWRDGRHLVVAVPGSGSVFRPSWPWVSVGHDRRGARAVEMARAVAAMARALGGVEAPEVAPSSVEALPSSMVDGAPLANPFAVELAASTLDGGPPLVGAAPSYGAPYDAQDPTPAVGPAGTPVLAKPARAVQGARRGGAVLVSAGAWAASSLAQVWRDLRGIGPVQRIEEAGMERWDALRGRLGVELPEPTMSVRRAEPVLEGGRKEPVVTLSAKPAPVDGAVDGVGAVAGPVDGRLESEVAPDPLPPAAIQPGFEGAQPRS
jgi:hypothetical protein